MTTTLQMEAAVNPTKYREVYGAGCFQISFPREFCDELGIKKGTNLKLELVEGKIVVSNADVTVEPPAKKSEKSR